MASKDGDPGPSSSKQTTTLEDILNSEENRGYFVAYPRDWCPHLDKHVNPEVPKSIKLSAPCQATSDCQHVGENWLCLSCHGIYCSRYVNEHMLMHGVEENHLMSISFSDLSVWCYGCEDYVDNALTFQYKDLLHRVKFDQPCPPRESEKSDSISLQLQ